MEHKNNCRKHKNERSHFKMTLDQCYQTNTKSIKIQAGSVNNPNVIDELILKLQTKCQISLNKGGKTSPTRHQDRNGERTMARVQKQETSGAEWGTQEVCVSVETRHGGAQGSGQSKPSVKAAMVGSRLNPSVMGCLLPSPSLTS